MSSLNTFLQNLAIFAGIVGILILCLDAFFASPKYKGRVSDHFDGIRFFSVPNPDLAKDRKHMSFLKWLFTMEKNKWKNRPGMPSKPSNRVANEKGIATFINHSTVLIQIQGLNILTDPIWANRASPISFFGPKRHQDPGVELHDVPAIDVVLLSHNHYDHMDVKTLRFFSDRDKPKILTHLGNSSFLIKKGIQKSHDMDWWDTHEVAPGIFVTSVPAQHFSARALSDRNKTLWGGFVISTPEGAIYFAADTGYGPFSKQIAQRFPNGFRFALLPIGAFSPRFFMREMHMSPEDAYILKDELKVQKALAIHLGTFKLAGDSQDEPVNLLQKIASERNDNSFVSVLNGQSVEF